MVRVVTLFLQAWLCPDRQTRAEAVWSLVPILLSAVCQDLEGGGAVRVVGCEMEDT